MNDDKMKGSFKQMSGSLKEKWGRLTDDEIAESKGKQEYLVGKVQKHYGKSKDAATQEVNDFLKSFDSKEPQDKRS